MSAIPLRWLSDREYTDIARQLNTSMHEVVRQWAVHYDAMVLNWETATESPQTTELLHFVFKNDAGVLLSLLVEPDFLWRLGILPQSTVVDAGRRDGLLHDLLTAVIRQFVALFLKGVDVAEWQLEQQTSNAKDSDTVSSVRRHQFMLQGKGHVLAYMFVLSPALLDHVIKRECKPTKEQLTSCLDAIAGQSVRIRGRLGQVTVPLQAMRTLVVGDVILMDTDISSGVLLTAENGEPIASGELGRQETKLVVRVTETVGNHVEIGAKAVRTSK